MSVQDETWLKDQMELRSIPSEALAKLVNENPLPGFHTPMAGLKWLVKKFRAKTRTSLELASALGAVGTLSPPTEGPRYEICSGSGHVLERIEGQRPIMTDQYCDCRMGRELAAVDRRVRTATAPAEAQAAGEPRDANLQLETFC
jgi:hypothetical protein